jgi:glycosyltransferase involved in cell wall biosynthesis
MRLSIGDPRVTPRLAIITEVIAPYRIPLFNALARRPELELEVLFLSENDPTLRQWRVYKEEINFPYHVLPSWRRRFGGHSILLNRGLHSALNRLRPDVIVCGGYNYPASWHAAGWANGRRTPFLLWSESTSCDRRRSYAVVESMKRLFLRLSAGFVVPGKSSAAYLKDLGAEERKIFTAPNAIDISRFSEGADAARKNHLRSRTLHGLPQHYFLYVGRLVKDKGVFDLLEAYAQLSPEIRAEVSLVLAGAGSQLAELKRRGSKIAPGRVQFLDFVHREDLPAVYALADAFILPTHTDPWGLVINEAMACSLPVIVTNVAGCAPDLVEHDWNGLIVRPGEVTALRDAMTRLATDSQSRTQMGGRSRQRIEAYSPAAWAQGIHQAVRFACGC